MRRGRGWRGRAEGQRGIAREERRRGRGGQCSETAKGAERREAWLKKPHGGSNRLVVLCAFSRSSRFGWMDTARETCGGQQNFRHLGEGRFG